ncbi:MAG TPA: TIGR01777 family oxidoreductase [Gemmatimonadaceae bacterium]|nr:TIGR01777 family oxidoreductase [Gemmatimonadaceae bacterium]
MTTVAITGASGFLGSALVRSLRDDNVQVIRIGRGTDADVNWDPNAEVLPASPLLGIDAVVHLAGENIGQRWTRAVRRRIRDSRTKGTALLARTLAALPQRPRVLLSASAAGIYGAHRGNELLTEASTLGSDFLATICKEWEGAAQPAREAGIRVLHLRTGIPLHPSSGVLQRLMPIFSLGIGGRAGSGKQWMSWIARTDWIRAVRFLLAANVEGPFNISALHPVTNATFTETLGHVLKRPTVTVAPEVALKLVYGQMAIDTILASQRVIPERLQAAGFEFRFPELEPALRHELKER